MSTEVEKKKVLVDVLPLGQSKLSGIGHVILNLVRELDNDQAFLANHDLVLICNKNDVTQLKSYGFNNVNYQPLPLRSKFINALNLSNLLPPVDLFIGRGTYIYDNYTTWPLQNSKSITFIYDIGYELYPEFTKPKVYKILHKNVAKWIRRSDKVVTISKHSKDAIHSFYGTKLDKIKVAYCGVDRSVFYPRSLSEVKKVRDKYGLKKPYILFLSNIEPRKNLERLIEAFELLPAKQRDQLSLLLVGGDGWRDETIKQAIIEAKNHGCDIIRPTQYVPDEDVPALYTGAELLAHPAVYEGFGMSVLEAMACGTPVLVSKEGSLPEVVGDAGVYVDYKSAKDIAENMSTLLTGQSLRKELRVKGLKRSETFSWREPKEILKQLIEQLET